MYVYIDLHFYIVIASNNKPLARVIQTTKKNCPGKRLCFFFFFSFTHFRFKECEQQEKTINFLNALERSRPTLNSVYTLPDGWWSTAPCWSSRNKHKGPYILHHGLLELLYCFFQLEELRYYITKISPPSLKKKRRGGRREKITLDVQDPNLFMAGLSYFGLFVLITLKC